MPVVMGTAGHIDHGKTTLIKALTGVDCDRLEEEKRRGITIELGFAELRLPPGAAGVERAISIIDVPGHERFVHTMVAGASGIDFVLLVIAADEGVMPQTREHLEICSLLGVTRGLVALTKIDAVDEDLLALAQQDVTAGLRESFLRAAPIIPVSARTGQGLDRLLAALAELESAFAPLRSQDLFRIPVDRIFSLRGHGTIITGTMIAGRVKLGDTVQIYPGRRTSKVRGLQSHFGKVEEARAGRRIALNLPDLAVEDIRRGDVVSRPGALFPVRSWLAWITCLPSSPQAIKNRAEIHLHHGAREIQARLYFTDLDQLQPGQAGLGEIRLPEEAVGVFGDRLVLRSFSPLRTIAGGILLGPLGLSARKREKGFAERCRMMRELRLTAASPGGQAPEALENLILTQLVCTRQAVRGLSFGALQVLTNLDSRALEKILSGLMSRKLVFCLDKTRKIYAAEALVGPLAEACRETVTDHHRKYPEKQGLKRSELMSGWGQYLSPKLSHFIIEQLIKNGDLEVLGEYVRRPAHRVSFNPAQAPLGEMLLRAYQEAGWAPPSVGVLFKSLKVTARQAMPLMASHRSEGRLVRVSDDFWYAAEHLDTLEKLVREWFTENETLDILKMKAITGLSRKHIIPLLEYFDAQRITIRSGDVRLLGNKA